MSKKYAKPGEITAGVAFDRVEIAMRDAEELERIARKKRKLALIQSVVEQINAIMIKQMVTVEEAAQIFYSDYGEDEFYIVFGRRGDVPKILVNWYNGYYRTKKNVELEF